MDFGTYSWKYHEEVVKKRAHTTSVTFETRDQIMTFLGPAAKGAFFSSLGLAFLTAYLSLIGSTAGAIATGTATITMVACFRFIVLHVEKAVNQLLAGEDPS